MTLHLLKLIWNQRKANALIIMELFLVFILLWVCNYQLYVYFQRLNEPLGFDYKHVYKVLISELPDSHPDWQEGRNHIEEVYELMDRLRVCPGVENVSISLGAMPFDSYYSGGRLISDSAVVWLKWGDISPEFVDVFRLKPQNPGVDLKKELEENRILMSPDVWERLFPEGTQEYVFHLDEEKNESLRTKGITTPVKLSAYHSPHPHAYDYLRKNELIEFGGNVEVMIRVQPLADKNFPAQFKEQMKGRLTVGNTYVIELASVEEFKKRYYAVGGDEDNFYQQLFILGFFMVNVFLGIIGTFWLRTEGRREEMGLRIAVGSSRSALKAFMIREGLLMMAIIWLPAVFVCLNLGYGGALSSLLDLRFTWEESLVAICLTTIVIGIMIIAGILYPAHQSAGIEPAEALHYE